MVKPLWVAHSKSSLEFYHAAQVEPPIATALNGKLHTHNNHCEQLMETRLSSCPLLLVCGRGVRLQLNCPRSTYPPAGPRGRASAYGVLRFLSSCPPAGPRGGRPPTASSANFSNLNLVPAEAADTRPAVPQATLRQSRNLMPAEAADTRPRGPAGYPLLLARFDACGSGEHPSRTPTRATLFRLKVYDRNFGVIGRCYLQQIFGCIPVCRGGDNCDLG